MRALTLAASITVALATVASTPPTPTNLENASYAPSGFEENKGQVRTIAGDAAPYGRHRPTQGNTRLFMLENGIANQFDRTHLPAGYSDLLAEAHGAADTLHVSDSGNRSDSAERPPAHLAGASDLPYSHCWTER